MSYGNPSVDAGTLARIDRITARDRARRGLVPEPTVISRLARPDELYPDRPISGLELVWSQARPRPIASDNTVARRIRPLTALHIETWRHVQQQIDLTGQPPNLETLRAMAGGVSKSVIVKRLARLQLAGMVTRDPVSRRLQLLERVPVMEQEGQADAA